MFTKMNKKLGLLGFTAGFIYSHGRIVTVIVTLELSVMLSRAQNQNKKGTLRRPTRRTKTLGMNEDFYVLLSRTAYSRTLFLHFL